LYLLSTNAFDGAFFFLAFFLSLVEVVLVVVCVCFLAALGFLPRFLFLAVRPAR
jgi:hypothetical protein